MEWEYQLSTIGTVVEGLRALMATQPVVALHGPMGAGKTTLVNALCKALGVTGSVSSPTFSIINEYTAPGGSMYHIDLYRLNSEVEAVNAGVEDCLYSGRVCLVEWPEKAPHLFPDETLHVFIEVVDPHTRRLQVRDY